MSRKNNHVSPAVFGIALLCFSLPFFSVSCHGQKLVSVNGFQLVIGTTVEQPPMFGRPSAKQRINGEPLAVLTFISGLIGLVLCLSRGKTPQATSAIAGLSGAVLLLIMKAKLDADMLREAGGLLRLNYEFGYWITFVLFIAGAIISLSQFSFNQRLMQPPESEANLGALPYLCPRCGQFLKLNVLACPDCGTPNPRGKPTPGDVLYRDSLNSTGHAPSTSISLVGNNFFCSDCGERVRNEDSFCGNCGAQVASM